jgi:hypothetical protein
MTPELRLALVLACFLLSGFAALLDQTVCSPPTSRARADALAKARVRRFWFDHFFVARLVGYLAGGVLNPYRLNFLQPHPAELGLDAAVIASRLPQVTEVLDRLKRIGAECGCRLLITPVPARVNLQGSLAVFRTQAGLRRFDVVDIAHALRVALTRDRLSPSELFFVHDDHLNAYGNRLYGGAVAAAGPSRLLWSIDPTTRRLCWDRIGRDPAIPPPS